MFCFNIFVFHCLLLFLHSIAAYSIQRPLSVYGNTADYSEADDIEEPSASLQKAAREISDYALSSDYINIIANQMGETENVVPPQFSNTLKRNKMVNIMLTLRSLDSQVYRDTQKEKRKKICSPFSPPLKCG